MFNGSESYFLWIRITFSAFMVFSAISAWNIGQRKKALSVEIFLYWTSVFYFFGALIYSYLTFGYFKPMAIPMVLLALFFSLFDLWLIERKQHEKMVLKRLVLLKITYALLLLVGPFWG